MSNPYLDGDTFTKCHQALRDGVTLDELAGKLHFDRDHLARLLQLPTSQPVTTDDEPDLWRTDELDAQL